MGLNLEMKNYQSIPYTRFLICRGWDQGDNNGGWRFFGLPISVRTCENGHELSGIVDSIRSDVCVQHLPESQYFSSTLAAKINMKKWWNSDFLCSKNQSACEVNFDTLNNPDKSLKKNFNEQFSA